ncbi:MAG: hypothetical protein KDA81_20845 [Planctomycetaceae bacterium]|nr:hypothetical protein [Planctomycetaceae bacterium]
MDEEVAKRFRRIASNATDALSNDAAGLNNVLQVAVNLCEHLETLGIPFSIIGGIAVQRWGEPRQTVDVDATLFVGFGNEGDAVRRLLKKFQSRIEDAHEFALQNRILLLRADQGTAIDLSLGGLPFEERLIERSSVWSVPRHGHIHPAVPKTLSCSKHSPADHRTGSTSKK